MLVCRKHQVLWEKNKIKISMRGFQKLLFISFGMSDASVGTSILHPCCNQSIFTKILPWLDKVMKTIMEQANTHATMTSKHTSCANRAVPKRFSSQTAPAEPATTWSTKCVRAQFTPPKIQQIFLNAQKYV